jgi:iron complex transport system ATP-binding protein
MTISHASRLVADDLSLGYGDRTIIEHLDLAIHTGVITTVIGPNGCGKSTLLRSLGRLLKPKAGSVMLDGRAISSMKTKEVARTLGMLPQAPTAPEGLTVADLVSRGRHPHQSWIRQWSSDDEAEVANALELTGVGDLADRPVDELSGGHWRRAPTSCCWTSRPPTSTSPTPSRYSTSSIAFTRSSAAPSSWCCTISTSHCDTATS